MMNILSIGNSFTQDTQRYLHQIAESDGFKLNAYNLFIGNCSLSTHYRNMLSEQRVYALEMNGESTGFNVSLNEAILSRDWDVVTVQQVSSKAPDFETYEPYLDKLVSYIRDCLPKTKIAIHQTWAYEENCKRLTEELGYKHHTDMFADIEKSYEKAAEVTGADYIIPSGELFQKLLACGVEKVHRDTFHASLGLGRYALGLLWYAVLSGNDVTDIDFSDFDEEISEKEIEIAKKCVKEICK